MLEVVAITCDGAQAAERQLADLRAAGNEAWLGEVSIIEHDADGRYSVKAKNPSVTDKHAGKGAAWGTHCTLNPTLHTCTERKWSDVGCWLLDVKA